MAAIDADPTLLLSAFLRMVRRLHGTVALQVAWLGALQQQALIGSASGIADCLANLQDFSASGVAAESSSKPTMPLEEMAWLPLAMCAASTSDAVRV
jgi:hypothetical protein